VAGGPDSTGGWHTYRVEVTGESVRLLVDGALVSQAAGPVAGSGEIGLYAGSTRVNVRHFSVQVAGRGATTAPSGPGSGGGGGGGDGGSSSASGAGPSGPAGGGPGTAGANSGGATTSTTTGGGAGSSGSTAAGATGGSASGGSTSGGGTSPGTSITELEAGTGDGGATAGTNAGTGQQAPPAQPTTLRASAGTSGAIQLSWVDNAHDASSLAVTIAWPNNLVVQWLAAGTTSLVFDRAEPQTTYRVTVAACNRNGCSARDETQVRTP
jgi:hypothetical protein